jgi:peroxiredoxin Q/BCP
MSMNRGEFIMLSQNDTAPDFTAQDQNGKEHRLSDYRGKWVILYFYPRDMTPGCTTEACNFRDSFPDFSKLNVQIIGVSKDSVNKHAKFAEKYDLPFTLLSDEGGTICEDYGVWKEKSMFSKKYMGIIRTTYLVNPDGKIARVFPKVKVKEHAAELMQALNEYK